MKKDNESKAPKLDFETSRELRTIVAEQFEVWKRKNFGGLEVLSQRCGVSSQYLSQVYRYGRIPGRPVLILLALNFDMEKPEVLFRAAGVRDQWIFDDGIRLGKISKQDTGFVSLKIDMEGFTSTIRDMIRTEIRPRNLEDLVGKRPLRIGLYVSYHWLYDKRPLWGEGVPPGIMPDFCRLLGVSVQREVSFEFVPFVHHIEELKRGSIDLFGPMMLTPRASDGLLFTNPLHKVGISVLIKRTPSKELIQLPRPKSLSDLIEKPYKIAVLRDSLPHLLANTKLRKSDEELVICETDEEAVDRMLVRGVKKSAHFFLCNSLIGADLASRHKRDLELIFNTRDTLLDLTDIVFAVRPDFQAFLLQINDSLAFLLGRGGFKERIESRLKGELADLAGIM